MNVKHSERDLSQLSFLVLEDHEFQRNMVAKMLRNLDVKRVDVAANGRDGLAILHDGAHTIDVIISDLDMPGMDGLEFIRHLAASGNGTSLIVASGQERGILASVEGLAAEYGINFLGSIEKPITHRKLEELLTRHRPWLRVARVPRPNGCTFTRAELRDALVNGEIEAYYQPKIAMATGRVIGAEALARWRHPERGLVLPGSFVGLLEESGDIRELLFAVLRKSARFARAVRDAGYDVTIAINVSVKSLNDVALAQEIATAVEACGAEPRSLVLEITESAATTNLGTALENLARLRMKGFGLSIDDYGTGYSSLEQLARIPFTELKIDQAFVTHAERQESAKVILASSLEMTRRLRIKAVAEGVETRANWDLLMELGCDVAQGYYIAHPMNASDFMQWLAHWPLMQSS